MSQPIKHFYHVNQVVQTDPPWITRSLLLFPADQRALVLREAHEVSTWHFTGGDYVGFLSGLPGGDLSHLHTRKVCSG